MSEFSLKEDWKYINWKATLITNLYRSIAAGIVWMVIGFFMDGPNSLLYPIAFPFMYFIFFLPIGLLSATLSRMGIPLVGIISFVFGLVFTLGDPILFIFHKMTNEKLIPTELSILTFAIIIFVVDENKKAAAL